MYAKNMLKAGLSAIFLGIVLCAVCPAEGGELQHRSTKAARDNPIQMQRPDLAIPRLEKKIHDLINMERKKKGLSALQWNDSLNRIARRHSQDMSTRHFFSHNNPDGKSFMDRYAEEGFACRLRIANTTCFGAENIAQDNLYRSVLYLDGMPSYDLSREDEIAASVVTGWMHSKGHQDNILTPYFKRQGIGISISDNGKVYVTQNFC